MEYFWIGVAILAFVCGILAPFAAALGAVAAAIVAMIMAFFDVHIAVQVLLFLLLTFVFIFVWRCFVRRGSKTHATGIDAVIGEKALVVEKIENIAGAGQVNVHGQCWSARTVEDADVYELGEHVTVVAVEGVRLICKK